MLDPLALGRRAVESLGAASRQAVASGRNGLDYLRGTDLEDLASTPTHEVWTAGKVRLRGCAATGPRASSRC